MATGVRKKRKASVDSRLCVACGCCVKVCPLGAIYVADGLHGWDFYAFLSP